MEAVLLALQVASLMYGVPYSVLYGIAKVESNLHPYAVNVEGRSYFPKSKEEALALVRGKKNYDLGLMQINSFWIRKLALNPEWLLNIEYNAKLGAMILRYCTSLFGNTWKAIDCYHRGEARAKSYSEYTAEVCSVLYGKRPRLKEVGR